MKTAFFNTRSYEQAHFDQANSSHHISYFAVPLNEKTAEGDIKSTKTAKLQGIKRK